MLDANAIKTFIFRKRRLRQAYRETFLRGDVPHPFAEIVLAHLSKISRSTGTTVAVGRDGRIDPLAMAFAEGQRALFGVIVAHLNLDDSDLYNYERAERAANKPE